MVTITRRSWLRFAGVGSLASGVGVLAAHKTTALQPSSPATSATHHASATHGAHLMGPVGRVNTDHFNPSTFLRTWNFSDLRPSERAKYYRETPQPDGTLLREYNLFAVDREIEIAPGVFFPAWTYNGQVPGPTIRATEGDRVRVTFINQGAHPHTIHFHGWHPPEMDGSLPEHEVPPGGRFVYDFTAEPFGLH
ncbi:MAG: multicopper oxidase domain-containing protein, partial [Vicinamibacteraceae bacterium]